MAKRKAFERLDSNRIVRPSSTTPRPPARFSSDRSRDKHLNTKKSAQKRKANSVSPLLWNTETKTPRISNCAEKASTPRGHPQQQHRTLNPRTPRTHPTSNRANDKNPNSSLTEQSTNRPREPISSATAKRTTLAESKQREPHVKVEAGNDALEVESPKVLSELSSFEDTSSVESPPSKAVSFQETSLNRIRAAARMTPVANKRKKSKNSLPKTLSTPAAKFSSVAKGRIEPEAISAQKSLVETKARECGRRYVHFERPPQPEMFSKAAIQELQKHSSSPDDKEVFEAVNNGPPRTSKSLGPMMGRTVGGRQMQRVDSLEEEELTVDSNIHETNDSPQFSDGPSQLQRERLADSAGRERIVGTKNARPPALDGQAKQNHILDSFLVQTMVYPEFGSSEASPDKAKETRQDNIQHPLSKNHSQRVVCFPEVWSLPDDDTSVNSKNFIFEIKGKKYLHPALPPGWVFRVSRSQGIPFYEHPDHGFTYYCPVPLPVKPNAAKSACPNNSRNYISRLGETAQSQDSGEQLSSPTSIACPQVTYSPHLRQHYSVRRALYLHPLEDGNISPKMPDRHGFPRMHQPLSSQKYIPGFQHQSQEDAASLTIEVPRGLQLPRAGHRLYQNTVLASEQSPLEGRISPWLSDEVSRFLHMSQLYQTQQKEPCTLGISRHSLEIGPAQLASMDYAASQNHHWQARQSNDEVSPLKSPACATTPPPGLKLVPSSGGQTNNRGKIEFDDDRHQACATALLRNKVIGSHADVASNGDDMELCSQTSEELFSLETSVQAQSDAGTNEAVVQRPEEDMTIDAQPEVVLTSSSKKHTLSGCNGEEAVTGQGQHRCGNKTTLYARGDTATLSEDNGTKEDGSCSGVDGDADMELSEDDYYGEEPATTTKCGEDSSREDFKTSPESLSSGIAIHHSDPTTFKHGEDSCNGDYKTSPEGLSSEKEVNNEEAASSPETGADSYLKDRHDNPGNYRDSSPKEYTETPLYNSETEVSQDQTPSSCESTALSMSPTTDQRTSSPCTSNESKPTQSTNAAGISSIEERNDGTFQNMPAGSHDCSSASSNTEEDGEVPQVATVTVHSHSRSRKLGSPESRLSFNQEAEDKISAGPRVVNLDEASFVQRDDEELSDFGSPIEDGRSDKDMQSNTRTSNSSSESQVGCSLSPNGNEESPSSPRIMSPRTPHRLCSLQNATSFKNTGMYADLYSFAAVKGPYAFQEKIAPRKHR